jgi:hypothetical protein
MASSPEYREQLSWSIMRSALYRMFSFVIDVCSKAIRFTFRTTYREGTHAKYHYLICGVKGDFTRNLVPHPPTHLWTRQLKVRRDGTTSVQCYRSSSQFAGISNTSSLYRRGIHVCTGSGIGAALSTCLQVRQLLQSFLHDTSP